MILVLDRRRAVGSVPSIQMYSALKVTLLLLKVVVVAPDAVAGRCAPRMAESLFGPDFLVVAST
jgi:hypothetical protein